MVKDGSCIAYMYIRTIHKIKIHIKKIKRFLSRYILTRGTYYQTGLPNMHVCSSTANWISNIASVIRYPSCCRLQFITNLHTTTIATCFCIFCRPIYTHSFIWLLFVELITSVIAFITYNFHYRLTKNYFMLPYP